jgi:predicted secreted protein
MNFQDNRGRKIVYISCCLLNQNTRAAGIAVRKGPCNELIQILLANDIGIEQMPCPERLYWGGVGRRGFSSKQPFVFSSIGKWWSPITELFAQMWLANSARGMRKLAGEVVTRIADFTREGYTIIGVIGVDDSPSCGVTKNLDIMGIARNQKSLGITLDDVENPQLDKMKTILDSGLIDGAGYFLGPIMEQLSRRSLNIPVIGFDPWADQGQEAERIANVLNLEISV